MTVSIYPVRLFGGRNLTVTFDSSAGTLSIAGQSIALSSLSASLQSSWTAAISASPPVDNIDATVGLILDQTPAWRSAISNVLFGYTDSSGHFIPGMVDQGRGGRP